MSTTATPDVESHDCDAPECETVFKPWEAFHGSYCSERCFYRHKGHKAIHNVADDHTWCATCFRRLKEIEDVPDHVRNKLYPEASEAAIGFQHPTDRVVWATGEASRPDWQNATPIATTQRPPEIQRWGCECGAVNPRDRHDVVRDADPAATLVSLLSCLRHLHTEDNVAHAPSKDALFDAYRDRPKDWTYIAGRAIYCE